MKITIAVAAAAAFLTPAVAAAQDTMSDPAAQTATDASAVPAGEPTAPDGSPAFGIEPYIAVMGGYHDFDSDNRGRLSTACRPQSGCPDGGFVEGIVGINIPLGPLFIGAEGNIAKGFKGLDYEYGASGRAGARIGDSGLIYGKVGYQWVRTKERDLFGRRHRDDGIAYGGGVEVGPKDIGLGGITGNSGARLRLEVTTFDLQSIRPSAGVVFHF